MKRAGPRHSTVATVKPLKRTVRVLPPRPRRPPPPARAKIARPIVAPPPIRPKHPRPPRTEVARIIDDSESSLVDVLDSLLNKGVMLNADLILALADVDLVYVRLSALLCAADRVMPVRGL